MRLRAAYVVFVVLSANGLAGGQDTLSVDHIQYRPTVQEVPSVGSVPVDLLRYPINEKARQMLRKAMQQINLGHHEAVVKQLQDTLARYPESAAYAQSLLGVEYVQIDRFAEAVGSLEQAVALLPHDAFNRYNLGLSLACAGNFDRAEEEVRRATEMEPGNATMRVLLDALVQARITKAQSSQVPSR